MMFRLNLPYEAYADADLTDAQVGALIARRAAKIAKVEADFDRVASLVTDDFVERASTDIVTEKVSRLLELLDTRFNLIESTLHLLLASAQAQTPPRPPEGS